MQDTTVTTQLTTDATHDATATMHETTAATHDTTAATHHTLGPMPGTPAAIHDATATSSAVAPNKLADDRRRAGHDRDFTRQDRDFTRQDRGFTRQDRGFTRHDRGLGDTTVVFHETTRISVHDHDSRAGALAFDRRIISIVGTLTMLDDLARRAGVSPLIIAILLAVAVVQIAMQVYALVDLARRDVVLGGKKWLWVAAIALGSLPGTIAYLAVGRPPPKVDTPRAAGASTAGDEAARRAVDVLYNPRDSH